MLRYLALLLLAPWLLILAWAYFSYPKSLPRTVARRVFDLAALALAAAAVAWSALLGFDAASPPEPGPLGRATGAIWQQVLPALYGYGACALVLLLALLVRQWAWGRSASARSRQGDGAGR
jgi:hypothetical protein